MSDRDRDRDWRSSIWLFVHGVVFSTLTVTPAFGQAPSQAGETARMSWPQWRGPLGTGFAPSADPPVEWSESKNVRWKVDLPGLGHSTPVVWGDRLFVTTAIPFGESLPPKGQTSPGAHDNAPVTRRQEFTVLAIDRKNGEIVWSQTAHRALPEEGHHSTGSFASSSPVTDGERVFASFGSNGLYCFGFDGKLLWKRDLGTMAAKHGHGEGSSPTLSGEKLVVNWDHEGASFVAAFDKRSGTELWRVSRDEVTSWSTPIVVEHRGQRQLIVCGTGRIRGYDLATGAVVWECGGLSSNVVSSPVSEDGMVFAGSSYDIRAFLAVRLEGAKGDITGAGNVVWRRTRGTPYVPSPLLLGGYLYFLRHYQGILTRVVARTGEQKEPPIRLSGIRNIYASPVGAAGRVYVTDRDGATAVISHEGEMQVLAVNRLDDRFSASAAIVDRELFLRGERHLYCLREE